MPHRSKASTAAIRRKQSNNQSIQVSLNISDTGSLYNDSGDDNSKDKSLMSGSDDSDSDDINDDKDSAESLRSLQKLYTVFLHPNKQKEVQKRMVSNNKLRKIRFTYGQLKGKITQIDPV